VYRVTKKASKQAKQQNGVQSQSTCQPSSQEGEETMTHILRSFTKTAICNVSRQRTISTSKRTFFSAISSAVHHQRSNSDYAETNFRTTIHTHQFSTLDKSNQFLGYNLSSAECNVPPTIASRVGTNLHLQPKHPLHTIKTVIEKYWQKRNGFITRDDIDPIVSTSHNFDSLLIPPEHVSRSRSDTYYFNKETVLRTHTSAHQTTMLTAGEDRFLVTGDVYR
jgi:phenylalanyl-tRNA synthetase alpha subunit